MLFKQIVSLCEKQGFFRIINPFNNKLQYFQLGPIGSLLQENLRQEWYKHIVTNNENNVFFCEGDFAKSVDFVKQLSSEKLPYGVAEFKPEKVKLDEGLQIEEEKNEDYVRSFKTYFMDDTLMKCTMFISPTTSTRFFHQWQRQRKVWWRKFSASPGSYSLSEITTTNSGSQLVRVYAKFPWGIETVESIELFLGKHPLLTVEQLVAKDNRKNVQPHFIISTVSLASMFLNSIAECYEETNLFDEHREVLRFHRKIAPYKISFSNSITGNSNKQEMQDLSLYICLLLKNLYISCLLLPNRDKSTLERQYDMHDRLGVPYTIVLNENSLKNGVILLRSRDTTLKEKVHINDLPIYIEKIFRNY